MNFSEEIKNLIEIYDHFYFYIDDTNNMEENYENLMENIKKNGIENDKDGLKEFLYLLCKFTNHHHRTPFFYEKIDKLLLNIKNKVIKYFSNDEIFQIFKKNKRILLSLIKLEIMNIDESIASVMTNFEYEKSNYLDYCISNSNNKKLSSDFENKRQIGENDDYICQIIRNDSNQSKKLSNKN